MNAHFMINKKPRIICHMASSVDGRIVSDNWRKLENQSYIYELYERCHQSFKSEAWMCGRVTFAKDLTEAKRPGLRTSIKKIEKEFFIGDEEARSFAIAVDPRGKLGWKNNDVRGDHVIVILTKQAGSAYLRYLQQKGVSYLIAGDKEINFQKALAWLTKLFPIRTITLEGGGIINGSLLNEGLIDELSLLVIPLADGTPGVATTFEVRGPVLRRKSAAMQLQKVKKLKHGVLWLRYKMKK